MYLDVHLSVGVLASVVYTINSIMLVMTNQVVDQILEVAQHQDQDQGKAVELLHQKVEMQLQVAVAKVKVVEL
jgi:hypothetical protein